MQKIVLTALCIAPLLAQAQQPLLIPDTLSGTSISLTMHQDSVQLLPGQKTKTLAFNNNHYLGPTLILQQNNTVHISVNNQIGDTTSVHWHGLHIAPTEDGGPHTPILPAATWTPSFQVMNSAATYWYHPHIHMKTAAQVMLGAAGMIIIRDAAEAAITLPRKYGVDDFPVIVQSQQLDTMNQIEPRGMVDSIVLVNGRQLPYGNFPAQVVRMRLLNAAGERNFNFGFSGNKSFYVIANDNGLLSAPVATNRIRLSPGERVEILIDLSGMAGQTLYLMSYASELPMGVQGGPTMPMPPGFPPMNSSLNGIDFNVLKINVGAATATPVTTIPSSLVPVTPYAASSANMTRTINFTADSALVMDGPFYFNDSSFDMMHVNYRIPLNSTEIWKFTNQTMVAHPFHIHDVHFFILDRNGVAPDAKEAGKKDVLLVQPNETARIIMKFEDFADTTVPYMYHCHVLMHEDDGMMGQFVVTPDPVSVPEVAGKRNDWIVYPNPATDDIHLLLPSYVPGTKLQLSVKDLVGKTIFETALTADRFTIATKGWSGGMYLISLTGAGTNSVQKVSVQR